jgi:putative ABC transport system permease protein
MKLSQGIRMAWGSVRAHPMRTLLTVLGILIGVAAVTVMVSIGQGSTKQVQSQLQSLGTNLVSVNILGRGVTTSLTERQVEELTNLEGIAAYAPSISGSATAKYGTATSDASLEATTSSFAEIRNYKVAQGRFLLDIDNALSQKVAVVGSTIVSDLKLASPIGEKITIQGIPFRIVGVLESKGSSAVGGDNDNKIFIPLQTARLVLKTNKIRTIYIQVADAKQIDGVVNVLKLRLTNLFRGNSDGFNVFNQQDMMDTLSSVSSTMTTMLGGIAAISLLVGGIGIMNIMLVSVTERTREIGIRKSLGAKRRDILFQFLMEAAMIGGMGGLAGIAAGAGGSALVGKLMSLPTSPSWSVMLLAFVFSLGVGLVFGIIPARRAARLNPVEALRQ